MSSPVTVRADRPPEFDQWPLEQQVDWTVWNQGRLSVREMFLDVLGRDREDASDRVTVNELVDAVELITHGRRVPSARCDREDCVRIFRDEIGVDGEGARITAQEMARFVLQIEQNGK